MSGWACPAEPLMGAGYSPELRAMQGGGRRPATAISGLVGVVLFRRDDHGHQAAFALGELFHLGQFIDVLANPVQDFHA